MSKFYGTKFIALLGFLGPFFFLFVGIMYVVKRLQGKPVWTGKLKPSLVPIKESQAITQEG